MAKKQTLEQVTITITRWQSKMIRAVRMIEKLEKQRKRLERAAARPPRTPVVEVAPPVAPPVVIHEERSAVIDTTIPAFLERKKLDPAAQQIADEQADIKRRKAAGRIAKMKAKKSGELTKMPLTGRAALAAIRNA